MMGGHKYTILAIVLPFISFKDDKQYRPATKNRSKIYYCRITIILDRSTKAE